MGGLRVTHFLFGPGVAKTHRGMLVSKDSERTTDDWSLPMIDADDRVIDIDWDDEYPHE